MLLDQIFSASGRPQKRRPGRSARGRPRANNDTRNVQVKAAVRRSEKVSFERLADARQTTLSDLIREYLLREAKREGIVP